MRKVIFGINISADGFCGHMDMVADEELHEHFTRLLRTADVILYGRITYQLMVPFWPEIAKDQSMSDATNEFARVFDSIEKIVFSTTLKNVEDKNSRLARADVGEEIRALKQLPGKDICVGSLSVASQLSKLDLIDEYHFAVHPVIAGRGPRLFDNVSLRETLFLKFIGSQTFRSGTVVLQYKRKT
ncbi:dihydrofolate reductase [Leptospira gomenensis]|uniref:Dihydrofolate reductase n=1 Tax=Leptospira gomenensis TaxID=2484974 RepID=A0A5F1YB12_9LEPT|nr:dihydrofolate reductase family protein [Leptospira gomenensis]TGK33302.1 dihydrofolate reductase [Leptospira gomenensis]TGK45105.1 dihydrofolate reductase [Leptospira gomenensis]TGK50890.1 dihydrofolate reductase [Leptospira gomenensis]TGK56513.1 dihydrofolate reductase [Leptospira gomenensis]